MTSDEFVDAVARRALDGAVNSTMANLRRPPGTRPLSELLDLSNWFNQLESNDQNVVERVVRLTATHAVTAFLCILDGAAAIEGGTDKGRLDLYYIKDNTRLLLNDPCEEPLNDKLHD
jgi:hypothetical protein